MQSLHITNERYPILLKEITDPPQTLYYKGNLELLKRPCISIIGSRKPTRYGTSVCKKIVPPLARANIVTISGLAYGIDTIVHKETMQAQGNTIAVLGSGLDEKSIYPQANRSTAKTLLQKNNLLLSEYPEKTQARKHHFIARNRIIAGLSKATLIIEAAKKSGTLITADFALQEGRDVLCIPGEITSANSHGTNTLIKQGAAMITGPADIFEALDIDPPKKHRISKHLKLSKNELQIIKNFTKSTKHVDKILADSTLDTSTTLQTLTLLEIKGLVQKIDQTHYTIIDEYSS